MTCTSGRSCPALRIFTSAKRPLPLVFARHCVTTTTLPARTADTAIAWRKAPRLDRMFAELLGKEAGYCKGKGGSMHIADPDTGNLGANAIVGGSAGIATGAALSAKRLEDESGRCLFLRRRRDGTRPAVRMHEHGRVVEAACDLRLRKQPLQRIHPQLRNACRRYHDPRCRVWYSW